MRELTAPGPPPSGKPLGRRERKKIETHRRIYRAAMDLFTEKGFHATTVDEIAERADVAKGTVFNYFPLKTSFLHTSYRLWFTGMMEEMGPVDSWTGGARARLQRVFDYMADQSLQHRALSRLIIFENMRQVHRLLDRSAEDDRGGPTEAPTRDRPPLQSPPEAAPSSQKESVQDPSQEGIRLMEGLARDIIRHGKSNHEIRTEVDEGHAAALIAGMAFHTLIRWLVLGGSAKEMKSALTAKLDIIFSGLAPRAKEESWEAGGPC
jgi:AcrR family transcriptional regulator